MNFLPKNLCSPFAHLLPKHRDHDFSIKTEDGVFFSRALALARLAQGTTHPNPPVGAVIVKNGGVLGEGFTQTYGGMHAEVHALRNALGPVTGATLYVTLEPCAHFGKTPPCTHAICEAGITRVVIGATDPNPKVFGKGAKSLRASNIEVNTLNLPALRQEAVAMVAPFRSWILRSRPYVILKIATSADNKVGICGVRTKITCQESDVVVHGLRYACDSLMVGANTVRIDDPELTARLSLPKKKQPLRVVMSYSLNFKKDLRILSQGSENTLLMTSEASWQNAPHFLQRAQCRVVFCKTESNRLDLLDAMGKLASLGYTSVLVEAGPTLFQSIIEKNLADEVWWFRSPLYLGAQALDLGISEHTLLAERFLLGSTQKIGSDKLSILFSQAT